MRKVVVLSTGGTIATRGGLAHDDASALLERLPADPGVALDGKDVFCLGSYLLTPHDMRRVVHEVHAALTDPDVLGVVVTHGTDSMEETAFLAELFHDDPRPVVFTGAQRPADNPDSDGPRNLADAIAVAASTPARDHGVLITFDGRIFPARGTRKAHTVAPAAFSAPDRGPIGHTRQGLVELTATPARSTPLVLADFALDGVRVDVVPCYPGTDTVALDAVTAAGSTGVVLEATGAGNANPAVRDAVARLTADGVVVALSTRVHAGPIAELYRNGGGIDLVEAGAVPVGDLRPSQARVLLTALLGCFRDPARVARELRGRSTSTERT
ncbi:L-asparaginase [Prauserella shujinwangii]|uniref:asparaginase n=1 Tax=Prauserella shujinwangii TaxID=1453103 RepID=A0A2T0LN79_9PSEU|nr:asparaginase [Prauserella shujinwangii]PRX44652.1 L-asparaginase [Prauserella shujinwangii]